MMKVDNNKIRVVCLVDVHGFKKGLVYNYSNIDFSHVEVFYNYKYKKYYDVTVVFDYLDFITHFKELSKVRRDKLKKLSTI